VWDVPSPLVVGCLVKTKVGAKCSAGCELTGHEIELHDGTGRTIARAGLSSEAWSGTNGLYWTEIEFVAPSMVDTHTWTVEFAHGAGRLEFTCVTVPPPECRLTIRILEQRTNAPLPGVDVRVGVYRASSGEQGLAKLELPRGNYTIGAWKMGYRLFSADIVVTDTGTVDVALVEELEAAQPYWM
jgi:hypothetical protein